MFYTNFLKILVLSEKKQQEDFVGERESPKSLRERLKFVSARVSWLEINSKDEWEQKMTISSAYMRILTGRGRQDSIWDK